jgi:hypothetical protein
MGTVKIESMLELKHIEPYFKHKLKMLFEMKPRRKKHGVLSLKGLIQMSQDNTTYALWKDKEGNQDWINIHAIKPILYPLDLTKPIWFEGQKIIPIINLASIAFSKTNIKSFVIKDDYVQFERWYSFHVWMENNEIQFDCRRRWNGDRHDGNCHVPNTRKLIEFLAKCRIDFQGLIPKRLATSVYDVHPEIYK